jgi:predicted RNase H-like HicB family nuclease
MYYPVAIHKDLDSDYGVSVPDLPGCFSAGATMDEAIDAAKEAILCHIEGIFTDDEGLPSSQSIENHRENELYADAVAWAIVDVDISALAGTTKRVNITMPEGVLSRIEEVSDNRSRFLTEAAVEKLSRQTRA